MLRKQRRTRTKTAARRRPSRRPRLASRPPVRSPRRRRRLAEVQRLDDIAADVVQSVLEDFPEDMDVMDRVQEAVDNAVPIYYQDQIDLLDGPDWEDIMFQDVADLISGARDIDLSKILPIAIYMAIEEKVMEKLNQMDVDL